MSASATTVVTTTMLATAEFKIRHVKESDLEVLWELQSDFALRGDFLPCWLGSSHEFRKQFNENGLSSDGFEQLLIVGADGVILGTIWHLKPVLYFNAREIGYILFSKMHRGKGLTTQAVRLLTDYLFKSLHINRLEIRMAVGNLASEKVAVKSGFSKEGVLRGAHFVQGRHLDLNTYALLREEWQLRQSEASVR